MTGGRKLGIQFSPATRQLLASTELSTAAKTAYLSILLEQGTKGFCAGGYGTLAHRTGTSRKVMRKARAELVAAGLVRAEKVPNGETIVRALPACCALVDICPQGHRPPRARGYAPQGSEGMPPRAGRSLDQNSRSTDGIRQKGEDLKARDRNFERLTGRPIPLHLREEVAG